MGGTPFKTVVGFVLAFGVLDLAALRFGRDSCDGAPKYPVPADPPPATPRRKEPTAKAPSVPAPPFRQRLESCPAYHPLSCPRLDVAALSK